MTGTDNAAKPVLRISVGLPSRHSLTTEQDNENGIIFLIQTIHKYFFFLFLKQKNESHLFDKDKQTLRKNILFVFMFSYFIRSNM